MLRPAGMEYSDSEDDMVLGTDEMGEGNIQKGYVHSWTPRPGFEGGFGRLTKTDERPRTSGRINKPQRAQRSAKHVNNAVAIEELRTAVMKCNVELVQQYLDQGVPVDSVASSGWTPLMYAACDASVSMVKTLLENGANVQFAKDGRTALMATCQCSCTDDERRIAECAATLIAAGAQVNASDWHHHMTSLMMAAKKGYTSVAELLIQNGAELNRQDRRGWTALCYAVSSGKPRIVRLLLESGADTTLECTDGQNAADLAQSLGNIQIANLFKETRSPDGSDMQAVGNAADDAASVSAHPVAHASRHSAAPFSDLEMFLSGLNLKDLIPTFQRHGITFDHFLTLSDMELQKMGVDKVGVRKKLLDATHDVHKRDWEQSSLPSSHNYTKLFSCADMTAIVSNVESHCKYIASTFTYISGQLKERPQLLDPGNDGRGVAIFRYRISQCQLGIQALTIAAASLEERVNKALSDSASDAPDVVTEEAPSTQVAKYRRRTLIISATAAAVFGVATVTVVKLSRNGGLSGLTQWLLNRS